MRDLGQSMALAASDAADKMSCRPKILACHFHFLRDFGKDILGDDHEHLRKLTRKLSVRENIRTAIGALRRKSHPEDMDYLHTWFDHWIDVAEYPSLPGGLWGISLVISLGQWILDYSSDSRNLGFPFDCPYHHLYQRCRTADKAIEFFLSEMRFDNRVNKALERLKIAFSHLLENKEVRKTVRVLGMRMDLFGKFRNIFRMESEFLDCASPNDINRIASGCALPGNPGSLSFEQFEKDMRNQVEDFEKKFRKKYEASRTGANLKLSIKIILDHLDKHGEFLWGHLVEVQSEFGVKLRFVDRTNNTLETFFHKMKHGERRRSGRKILTRNFENILPGAALAMNLTDPVYVKVVCGTLDNLPMCFSKMDEKNRETSLNTAPSEKKLNVIFNDDFLISCSDKSFIRKESINSWVLAAADNKPINALKESTKRINLPPFEDMEQFIQTVRI